MRKLVVIGGGFGGFWSAVSAIRQARELNKTGELEVVLISKDEYHSIKPRFYERNLEGIRVPLRKYFEPLKIGLVVGEVKGIDPEGSKISLSNRRDDISYDCMVFAAGSKVKTAGVPGMEHAFNVDDFTAASKLDSHIRALFASGFKTGGSKNVAVVGGGLTGIEVAASLSGRITGFAGPVEGLNVYLIERGGLASGYSEEGRAYILSQLKGSGVQLLAGESIREISRGKAVLKSGKTIETETVIWTAGLEASPLTAAFKGERDGFGRLDVDEFLRLKAYDNVFAAGDAAKALADDRNYALMSCQHAMPQGKFAGHNAVNLMFGSEMTPYSQPQYATCLDLGPENAIFTLGWDRQVRMTGPDAKKLKTQIVTQWIYPSPDVEETVKMSVPEVPSF